MLLDEIHQKIQSIDIKDTPLIINEAVNDLEYLMAIIAFLNNNRDAIIVCSSIKEAEHTYKIAKNLFNIKHAYFFPDFDQEPYSTAKIPEFITSNRVNTLYNLIKNKQEKKLVITSYLGVLHKTVDKSYLKTKTLPLKEKQNISISKVVDFLVNNGYERVNTVANKSDFAVRGDILDVYPSFIDVNDIAICGNKASKNEDGESADNQMAYRISFFDDEIESIKVFDVNNQRTMGNTEEIELKIPSEIVATPENIKNFKYEYQVRFGNFEKNDINFLSASNNLLPHGEASYLPIIIPNTNFIYSYLENPLFIILESQEYVNGIKDIFTNIINNYKEEYELRKDVDVQNNKYHVLPAHDLLMNDEDIVKIINDNSYVVVTKNKNIDENKYIIGGVNATMPHILSLNTQLPEHLFKNNDNINKKCDTLSDYLKEQNGKTVVLNIMNEALLKLIKQNFAKFGLKHSDTHNINDIHVGKINITNFYGLTNGFATENSIVICENDIVKVNKAERKRKQIAKNPFRSIASLKQGDFVAHIKHGVGKFVGLVTLSVANVVRDFLQIEYKDKDKLYVPVENVDLLGKYGAGDSEATLDKLGNSAWERKQERVKEKLKDIAYDLVKLSASRLVKKGIKINVESDEYTDFSMKFPYVETDDQLSAIKDIEDDFKAEKVMDRLVCGDVGFGKTEIAMRAAFLVANSGYQVAIIAPTTLLCRQHYYNFVERFKDFPEVKIAQLSRFVNTSSKKEIKEQLQEGGVNIIIGTHALLSKDVKFKNLGLLIVDEEQNFGVVHKEKIKALKENVHVLTLTATPIPRTLQLSLNQIKDLSIIATPPTNKLAIHTYITPFDPVVIKGAIEKEVKRKGQVFFVTPYIKDLEGLQGILSSLLPDLRILIINGSMKPQEIEQGMEKFQGHEFDLLLSTSIIESGIDLKNVNTIIVNNADKFGLSQLYQLRGRVGRGRKQAFAYITFKSNILLTDNAKKRLNVMQNLDYLGAGFSLAEHDLDIRGAGNILGEEQSGHIKEIGFDLYQKFLNMMIKKMQNQNGKQIEYEGLSPNIELGIKALISQKYVPDVMVKMDFYDRLANSSTLLDLEDIKDELIDRFGKIPEETINLITIIKFKILSKQVLIEKITCGDKGASFSFFNNKVINVDKLLEYVKNNDNIKIMPNQSLLLTFIKNKDGIDKKEQINQMLIFLNELKKIFDIEEAIN